MLDFAKEVAAGTDEEFPVRRTLFDDGPGGAWLEVVCSAARRLTAQGLPDLLRAFASTFSRDLERMERVASLAR